MAQALSAQITDRLHWVFPVDSVEQIKVEVVDPYTVVNWDGDKIMATSEITVHNASKGIVKFFIEENRRYDIVDTLMADKVLIIDSYTSRRAPIESKGQPCHESVQVKIMLPNDFVKQSDDLWVRKEEEEENK
jgi:hypothetical protein